MAADQPVEAPCLRSVANPQSSTAQNVVARSGFFMLRLRYVMVPAMKAAFTVAAGALTGKQDPLP